VPDDDWDLTPEEEARLFRSSRHSGIGCLIGVLIVTAIVGLLVLAAVILMDELKTFVHSID